MYYVCSYCTLQVSLVQQRVMILYRSVRSVPFARVLVGFVYSVTTTLPPAKSHCQMLVARVYFQQPIATQIELKAVPKQNVYPERRSRAPATPSAQRNSSTPMPMLVPRHPKNLAPALAHSPMPTFNTPPPANTSRYGRTLKSPDYQTD